MQGCDVIVIGSGPAGAQAAQTLLEAGLRVTMLDIGREGASILEESPGQTFESVRRTNPDQWKWFLGENFSGIPVEGMRGGLGGGMTSGNRGYAVREAEALLPLTVENGIVIQSVAKGGMGAVWGATSMYLDAATLERMGLPAAEMDKAYGTVTARIGVSGPPDRPNIQPPLTLDHHASALLKASARKKQPGIRFLQPHSAVLTQPLGKRQATTYADLDYVADPGQSLYRPQYTLDELLQSPRFTYIGGAVVGKIEEQSSSAMVRWKPDGGGAEQTLTARAVVLAAGTVGTARILAVSRGMTDTPLPFVGKPHAFSACLHPRVLGKAGPSQRSSLCQLVVLADPSDSDPGGCAQLYSYRSMLLFRLLGSVPLSAPEALGLLALLSPALVVADIRFPALSPNGELRVDGNGHVFIRLHEPDWAPRKRTMRRLHAAMRSAGLHPLKSFRLPESSTSHYAGTVPVSSRDGEFPLSTDENGKVRGMRSVWVADAAMFRMLPALPHTLTIMANAARVATQVATEATRHPTA